MKILIETLLTASQVAMIITITILNLDAQPIKSSFFLDTVDNKILPYDIAFDLKLRDSKDARIKSVYLMRLNKRNKVVPDKQTSFYKVGQEQNHRQLILKQLKKKYSESEKYLSITSNTIDEWKSDLKKKTTLLNKEINSEKKASLTRDVRSLQYKINKHNSHQLFIRRLKNNHSKLIRELKNESQLISLKMNYRDKDTLAIKAPPLKPYKDYLILAINERTKINSLKKLFEEYINYGTIEDKHVTVIPNQYLKSKSREKYKVKKPFEIETIKKLEAENVVTFTIPEEIFRLEFEKAKKNNIQNLIRVTSERPRLKGHPKQVNIPGPFKYPVMSKLVTSINDSTVSHIPKYFNKDFRIINSVLSNFNNYGDSIIMGNYGIIEDEHSIKLDFNQTNDLGGKLKNITTHIELVTRADQSLAILGEIEKDNYSNYNGYFSKVLNVLSENRDSIIKTINSITKLNKAISDMNIPYGLESTTLEKSTFSYRFVTRNSSIIKQSFGLLYYFTNKHDLSGVVPFTGVDFNLRPTNEDTQFWKIRSWRKYLGFQLAVPLLASDLTTENKRKHLVSSAFSLYTGISLNLGHSFKIGYGTILFRSIDSDSIVNQSYEINAIHSLSIGINFKLMPLFKNLFGSNKTVNLLE